MIEIRFYHLQRTRLEEALPGILAQAYKRGMRAVVRLGSKDSVKKMDDHLWAYKTDSFLPHGAAPASHAKDTPIWLSTKEENPNQANLLILADGVTCDDFSGFDLCCNIFDGNNPETLLAARDYWKKLKTTDASLKYFKQDETGRWQENATG